MTSPFQLSSPVLKRRAAETLPSLDLAAALESGYYCKTPIQKRADRPHHRALTLYRLRDQFPALAFRFTFYAAFDEGVQEVRSFPYVDENKRLRVWNVDKGEPFRIIGWGVVDGGLPPGVVRKRWPRLFDWAQQLGYWKDLK